MVFLVIKWAVVLAAAIGLFAITLTAAVIIGTLLLYGIITVVVLMVAHVIKSLVWIGEQLGKPDVE